MLTRSRHGNSIKMGVGDARSQRLGLRSPLTFFAQVLARIGSSIA